MLNDFKSKANDIGASWVELSRTDAGAKELVHKLHHRSEFELYDLRKDPYELRNEIDNPEYKQVAETLKQRLMSRLNELGDAAPVETERALVTAKSGKK